MGTGERDGEVGETDLEEFVVGEDASLARLDEDVHAVFMDEFVDEVGSERAAALPYARGVLASDADGELGGLGGGGGVRSTEGGAESQVRTSEHGHGSMQMAVVECEC